MVKKYFSWMLAAAMLLCPVQAAAREKNHLIQLEPPSEMSSAACVGKLSICCDETMNGSVLELHLYQQEGDLLYYAFTARFNGAVQVDCPLMKEGEYQLIVKLPQEQSPDLQSYCYAFSVEDPDPADFASEFDMTELTMHFSVDPSIESDRSEEPEPVLENRIYRSESAYTYARKAFVLGDMNDDRTINANDATRILTAAAAYGVHQPTGLSSLQTAQGDINGDDVLNAEDATLILSYSAAVGVNAFSGSIADYVRSRDMQ